MLKSLLVFASIFLVSCTGKIYTIVNVDIPSDAKNYKVEGVVFYDSLNVVELYRKTILVDKDSGVKTGKGPEECNFDYDVKFSTRTDFNRRNIVYYDPGYLESNKFSVELDKGVLKSVNSESTPGSALPGIAEILPFFEAPKASDFTVLADKKLPLCNSGARLIGVFRAPDIQPYEDMFMLLQPRG